MDITDKKLLDADADKLTVYYDGACPKCRHDRETYEKLSGPLADQVCWFDITGQDDRLRDLGIDPKKALSELHVRKPNGQIVSELDAYILLMKPIALLKPLAWLISLPMIRPYIAKLYHWKVERRLEKRGIR